MSVRQLEWQIVEKVWGRRDIPEVFGDARHSDEPVGEVWFQHGDAADLLVKRLFTSEKLSIQVHPSDEQARAAGYPRGKEEAWFVLSAEEGAVIGAGFNRTLTRTELRAAAQDGTIAELLTWHPIKAGDFFHVPAGTVHAIGAGLSVLEIQQNVDLTYRLHDYGRPRELQLDQAVAASVPLPYPSPPTRTGGNGRDILVASPKFVIERLRGPGMRRVEGDARHPVWLMPISGSCAVEDTEMTPGLVWLADRPVDVQMAPEACLLTACAGTKSA